MKSSHHFKNVSRILLSPSESPDPKGPFSIPSLLTPNSRYHVRHVPPNSSVSTLKFVNKRSEQRSPSSTLSQGPSSSVLRKPQQHGDKGTESRARSIKPPIHRCTHPLAILHRAVQPRTERPVQPITKHTNFIVGIQDIGSEAACYPTYSHQIPPQILSVSVPAIPTPRNSVISAQNMPVKAAVTIGTE